MLIKELLILLVVFLASFLLGSVPWGVVISKLVYKKDLRKEGSGNIGTTNAMRSLGKVGGAAVFLLDFGKGLLSGLIASLVGDYLAGGGAFAPYPAIAGSSPEAMCFACAFAGCTLGHIFSPWLKFKGGKGIAVAAACLVFAYGPVGFLIEIGVFAVLVVATRYVSVGSLGAAITCVILGPILYQGQWLAAAIFVVVALVVVWAHRENIKRLREGNENRIGHKK